MFYVVECVCGSLPDTPRPPPAAPNATETTPALTTASPPAGDGGAGERGRDQPESFLGLAMEEQHLSKPSCYPPPPPVSRNRLAQEPPPGSAVELSRYFFYRRMGFFMVVVDAGRVFRCAGQHSCVLHANKCTWDQI